MSKIDEVSEKIGQFGSDIRDLKSYQEKRFNLIHTDIRDIKQHLKIQNNKIFNNEAKINRIFYFGGGIGTTIMVIWTFIKYFL